MKLSKPEQHLVNVKKALAICPILTGQQLANVIGVKKSYLKHIFYTEDVKLRELRIDATVNLMNENVKLRNKITELTEKLNDKETTNE